MKKMFGLLVMFLLMGMLCGVAMASTDTGPPGVAVLMFSMGDALGDMAGTPTAAIVAEVNKFDAPTAIGRSDGEFGPAILVGCNHKNHSGTGRLGGVSLARGNPMATPCMNIKLYLPALA